MDNIQVSGPEEISNSVISSIGLSAGKCPRLSTNVCSNISPCGNGISSASLAEDLGNLSFNDESIKNTKLNLYGHKGANGLVNGIIISSDVKPLNKTNHKLENAFTDKSSSQYQKCSNANNVVNIANATHCNSSENKDNLKETKTLSSNNEPSCSAISCKSSEMNQNIGNGEINYVLYESELQMPDIMRLIQKDLSEPYSIYTYRYFIHNWPNLCFLAMDRDVCVGAIVCKLDMHRKVVKRGYIAMLAVDEKYRKRKIGSNLVLKAIKAMVADNADEVVLETEITNRSALRLYENLGFVRDKRLFRYYLNGVDALRLKLWLR